MRSPKTLLLGWDGADWEIARPLMEAGHMPRLSALVDQGAAGDLISYAPYLSPMLWTTIATGHHPDRHGVHGFAEVDPRTGHARATGTSARRTKALWNIVSEQGGTVGVAGWMGTFPAERVRGAFVSDAFSHAPEAEETAWPVAPGSVYPPALGEELAHLRLRPGEVDPALLGLFIPQLMKRSRPGDPRPRRLLQRLAQLYTLHNATVALVANGQPDLLAVYFHFIDLICHEFVMFHPPRHPGVGIAEYELYRKVVAGAYRVQDALLGDLLEHCAPDTRVMIVSDHGFTTGAARPLHTPRNDAGLAAWHRREGLFAAAGPGVARGREPASVRPQDIAPTILAWNGFPVGDDMPGRVLAEIFEQAPPIRTIPSWDIEPAKTPPPATPAAEPEPDEQTRLTQRFVELGYLDPSTQAGAAGGARVSDENAFALGTALRDLGRPADALPHLQAAFLADPEATPRATELALCLIDLGWVDEAEQAAATFFDHEQETPRALLLRAQILLARRSFRELGPILDNLAQTKFAPQAGGLRRLALLRSGRWAEARAAFRKQIQETPKRATAHLGLAEACLQTGHAAEAITAAQTALALDPASQIARSLLEKARGQNTTAFPPPSSSPWETGGRIAESRVALRSDYHERERAHLAARRARREAEATERVRTRLPVLVVSGAPRSGTSMMMRMLARAGMPVMTDGVREPDENNPLGYFEWEAVKRLAGSPAEIARAEGKAIKVVSPLLASLPAGWRYDVVFMRRDFGAILRSQQRMLAGSPDENGSAAGTTTVSADELARHVEGVLAWARGQPHIRLLELDYDEVVDSPERALARLVAFVGEARLKRRSALRDAVRRDLRHHSPAPVPDPTARPR